MTTHLQVLSRTTILATALVVASSMIGVADVSAQTSEDAIRFTQRQPMTGVRSLGLAGAGVAGIADHSALLTNPAGLGFYNHSSFSASLAFLNVEDQATYQLDGSFPLENSASGAGIGHAAFVYKIPTRRGSAVVAGGINQVRSFNREMLFRGDNGLNSVTDFFMPVQGEFDIEVDSGPDNIAGTPDDEYIPSFSRDLSYIAYELYAIDFDANAFGSGDPVPFFPAVTTGTVEQSGSIRDTGSMYELNFGAAFEAAPGVMVGGSVNVPVGRWELERFVAEEDINNDNDGTGGTVDFDYLEWTQFIESTLVGINARAGIAVRTPSGFSVGATIETPTYYEISEEYSTTMLVEFDNGDSFSYGTEFEEDAGAGEFDYQVISPWRVGLGIGYVGGDLSVYADAELVDWSSLELDADDAFVFEEENRAIREGLEGRMNLRVGAEYDFGRFVARAGLALLPDQRMPSAGRSNGPLTERDRGYVSAGLTYKASSQFELDLGWVGERFDDAFVPYDVEGAPVVYEDVMRSRFAIGVRARI